MKEARIDRLGRLVIPKPLREKLSITTDTPLKISSEGGAIRITPTERVCALCGRIISDTASFRLCEDCILMVRGE